MAHFVSAVARYTRTAIALHWLIAVLIFGGFGLGLYMHELPFSPQKLRYYSWHKWIGVTVFTLVLLRGIWRITHPVPAIAAGTPRWQRWAALLTHGALYALMFAVPLAGWLHSSAGGYTTVYLGLVPLPDLVGKDKALADALGEVHELLAFTMMALVALHVAAALKHQFVDRDGSLMRMLPRRSAGEPHA